MINGGVNDAGKPAGRAAQVQYLPSVTAAWQAKKV
jgi:hypothetical protein